eukprot:5032760-Amphidinium_carterae.1
MLKDAHITVLSELAAKLTKKLPMSALALQSVFNEQLANLSEPKRVSLSWTRAFLHDIGQIQLLLLRQSLMQRLLRKPSDCWL